MSFLISFTDFWQGHDPTNNILTNCMRDIFSDIEIVADENEADLCFVTIYGQRHRQVLKDYAHKSILWLGENVRPNIYPSAFSISFDFASYGGTNFRLPLWYSEIDWYSTGLGVIDKKDLYLLTLPTDIDVDEFSNRDFCITIFNNCEGTRMEALRLLQGVGTVQGFGRPFGNWFPTFDTYRDKLKLMGGFKYNLCPENSYYPGYYTEKCFHAKLSTCIPIYMCDQHVVHDFNTSSFININNYQPLDSLREVLINLENNPRNAVEIARNPLLNQTPQLDDFIRFLKIAANRILSNKAL